jgi:hypothetical protein
MLCWEVSGAAQANKDVRGNFTGLRVSVSSAIELCCCAPSSAAAIGVQNCKNMLKGHHRCRPLGALSPASA